MTSSSLFPVLVLLYCFAASQSYNHFFSTVDSGYKGMLNRGNSGYRGQFAADQNFYLVKAGQIEEKGAF